MKRNAKIARGLDRAKKRSRTDRAALTRVRPLSTSDWANLPLLGSEMGRSRPLRQSGVLAYRRLENGDVALLLVRKLRSDNWGIPKGKLAPHLTLAENAAKEAFEEAGVTGRIQEQPAATYRATKRVYGQKIVIEVSVHLLEVTKSAETWPEMAKRDFKWCPPREAAALLREPALTELCLRFA